MKKTRILGRKKDQRKALLKGIAANLILRGKIRTTEAKAKEVRPLIERLITKNKKNNLAGIRYAAKFLPKLAVGKLNREVAPRYLTRPGGYTRITKLGQRKSDGARIVIMELV